MRYEAEASCAMECDRKIRAKRQKEREKRERIKAAAPDLYEACKITLRLLNGDPVAELNKKPKTVIEEAVAKAEGKNV